MTVIARANDNFVASRATMLPGERVPDQTRPARSLPMLILLGILALAGIAALTSLGIWQLERRIWKLDLINRVDQRIHAAPVVAPGPAIWPAINAANDSYLRLRVRGRYLNDRETLVQAVTGLGRGFWVLTPLRTDTGFTVLVNRGFVPSDRRDPTTRAAGQITGETTVTGLLRMSEPKGGFLRANNPAEGHWYSRDVAAIAAARDLRDNEVAPYFVDADAAADTDKGPRGGLTVIAFPNNHLVYALTWFGLALMLAGASTFVARDAWHGISRDSRSS